MLRESLNVEFKCENLVFFHMVKLHPHHRRILFSDAIDRRF